MRKHKTDDKIHEQPAGMTIQVRSGGQFLIDPETPAETERTLAEPAAAEEGGNPDAHT